MALGFTTAAFAFSGKAALSRLCAALAVAGAIVATWVQIKGFQFPPKDVIACLSCAAVLTAFSAVPAAGWRMSFPLAAVASVVGAHYLLGGKEAPVLAGAVVLALALPSVIALEAALSWNSILTVLSFALAVFPGARVLEWGGSFSLAQMAASFNALVPALFIMAFSPSLKGALVRAMAVAVALWMLLMLGAWISLGIQVRGPLVLIALAPAMGAIVMIPRLRFLAWLMPLLAAASSVGAAWWCHHITGGSAY